MVRLAGTLGLIFLALYPAPASACRLALLLALDVSASVDEAEYLLQRNGLAAALLAPKVEAAFLSDRSPVALAAFEWSGRYNHSVALEWTVIRSAADLFAASEQVASATRSTDEFPTALGYALGHAASLLSRAPRCDAQTIDISGDGVSNDGFGPATAYRHFPLAGVTVNALAIGGSVSLPELVRYFEAQVIRGAGAFVETASDYTDFERAIRRKLEREVSVRVVGALQ